MKQYNMAYLATPAGAAEFLREADKFENRLGVEIVEELRREIQDRGADWCDCNNSTIVDEILRENGVFDVYHALVKCRTAFAVLMQSGIVPGSLVDIRTGLQEIDAALAKAERGNA